MVSYVTGIIKKGDKLVDGVQETLDMLPAIASSVSTMLHLWQEIFWGLSILHCHGHM
jgi:hypothetical protein